MGALEPDTVGGGLVLATDFVLHDFRLACDNAGVIRSIWDESMGSYGYDSVFKMKGAKTT